MRAYLCWDCGNLCKCRRTFPNGRPKGQIDCMDFVEAPPESIRITVAEISKILGCSTRTVFRILAGKHGIYRVTHMVKGKGITLTYERIKNRIYFYKEMTEDER